MIASYITVEFMNYHISRALESWGINQFKIFFPIPRLQGGILSLLLLLLFKLRFLYIIIMGLSRDISQYLIEKWAREKELWKSWNFSEAGERKKTKKEKF